jgi:uncharacterized membrane protein
MTKEKLLGKLTLKFILRHYDEIKQKSDDIDWKVHTTRLIVASKRELTVDIIGEEIYKSSALILEMKSDFFTELKRLNEIFPLEESWAQLLKVGIRNGWVVLIKSLYKEALKRINELSIEEIRDYVNNVYPPLTIFLPET